MKTIIITGSTRGIGFGLAENFLRLGHQVVISGRSQSSVDQAEKSLTERHPAERILGVPCDICQYSQVEYLWERTEAHFGRVDIWINIAGIGHPQFNFWEMDPEVISTLVDTNVTGAMYGARVALTGFMEQGRGAFYNMEGLGSDGRRVEGLTAYGATNRARNYLTDNLVEEVKGTDVIVGAISPGMVLTDFLLQHYEGRDPAEWEGERRIFNILADRVETVTPYLAEQVLKNTKNGTRIQWLTRRKAFWRFLTSSFNKRDLFEGLDNSNHLQ